jgi:hypothetical protein
VASGGAGEAFEVKKFEGSNGESIAYSLYTPEKTDGKLPLVLCLRSEGFPEHLAATECHQVIQGVRQQESDHQPKLRQSRIAR